MDIFGVSDTSTSHGSAAQNAAYKLHVVCFNHTSDSQIMQLRVVHARPVDRDKLRHGNCEQQDHLAWSGVVPASVSSQLIASNLPMGPHSTIHVFFKKTPETEQHVKWGKLLVVGYPTTQTVNASEIQQLKDMDLPPNAVTVPSEAMPHRNVLVWTQGDDSSENDGSENDAAGFASTRMEDSSTDDLDSAAENYCAGHASMRLPRNMDCICAENIDGMQLDSRPRAAGYATVMPIAEHKSIIPHIFPVPVSWS